MSNEVVLLKGGDVVRRSGVARADVLIRDGKIAEVSANIAPPTGATVVDASGTWVGSGFVDLHTHLREPGKEAAENVASGATAAVLGGYSAVVAMPNTEPALDSVPLVSFVFEQGAKSLVDVAVAGTITIGRAGDQLAPFAKLASLGVRLFTDDGNGVQDAGVMRRALEYAKPLGVTLAQHCEDESLAHGGIINEGAVSARLGLAGRPAIAEELMVLRDLELVRLTGCPMHFLHLSTARSVALVVAAKQQGLPVSCEIAPHHFTLDETACEGFDPEFKVHPPLRSRIDVDALVAALARGDVDAVATDHAPHTPESKDLPFDEAPPGMLGLEQAAALTLAALGGESASPETFFSVLSWGPARIAQLRASDARVRNFAHGGDLAVGDDANLVVFDRDATYTVRGEDFASKARNTPYEGWELRGRARATIVKGRLVHIEGVLR